MKTSRRIFIKATGAGIVAGAYSNVFAANSLVSTEQEKAEGDKLKLGLASYTFKDFSLEDCILMTKKIGLKHIALKSFHLPMESTKEQCMAAGDKVRAAGLDLYGCSVVVLTNEKEVNQAFDYAKWAGMEMIIAQPTVDLLDLIEKKVKEYNIRFAIHNHGPEDHNFPDLLATYEKLKKYDKRIGMCIDIGHARRSGFDPAESIRKCADRLIDVHIKDLKTIQTVADVCEVGRGKLDLPGVLRTLIKIKYSGIVSLEYEKDPKDPLAGAAESVGYTKGVLAVI